MAPGWTNNEYRHIANALTLVAIAAVLKSAKMHNISFLLLSFFLVSFSYSQPTMIPGGKPRALTKKERALDEINRNCIHKNKLSVDQRLKLFPFNTATQIKLVSFDRVPGQVFQFELPMKNDTVDYSRIIENILLNKNQIDTLTDILYNNGYRGQFYSIEEMNCYEPRNAILFINSSGKLLAFIELCFQCTGYRASSKKVQTGDFCQQKYSLLKKYFLTAGIKFGTQEEIEELSQ